MDDGCGRGKAAAVRERLARALASLGVAPPASGSADDLDHALAALDALDAALDKTRAAAANTQSRIDELSGVIEGIVAFDYSRRAEMKGDNDPLDGFAVCLNVLAEELGNSMVSKAYVNNIIESMADALMVLDKNGKIKTANAATSQLSGYTKSELVGKPIGQIFSDVSAGEIIDKKTALSGERACLTKAKGNILVAFSASVMRNRRGEFEGIVCVARDLTEAKQAEDERIRSAESMQRQAILLEELSTPLIPIADDVLVMPLIGTVDRERTKKICEALLHGVVSRRARLAILDITGVRVMDEPAVQGIITAVQCLRFVGAQVMLTGVKPQVASAIVGLGIDLGGVKTSGSLQRAINEALRRPARTSDGGERGSSRARSRL